MLVAFRADASVQIGTGHVMRCLTLADELRRYGHQCLFICRDHKGHLGKLITSKNFELRLLSASGNADLGEMGTNSTETHAEWLGVPWKMDAEQTFEVLTQQAVDWLVVDHYALDARWERQVKTVVGRVMVMDDLADRDHDCSLLLDQNLGRHASDYDQRVPGNCVRLIGPKYALLRPEFAGLRERSLQRRSHAELRRILISLGGVDRTNVTGQVLDALAESSLPHEIELDIIMGPAAPYLENVRQQAARLPFRATVDVNVGDMAKRMCLADLSIGAGGSTSWERCCLGLPTLLVILADNQMQSAGALDARGAARVVGRPEAARNALPTALAHVRQAEVLHRMTVRAAGLTKGDGAAKVTGSMTESAGINR